LESQQPFEVAVESQSLSAGEPVEVKLIVTSLLTDECHDVVITFKPPWQLVADKLERVGRRQLSPGERWVIPLQIESLPTAQGTLILPLKLRWLKGNQANSMDAKLEFAVSPAEQKIDLKPPETMQRLEVEDKEVAGTTSILFLAADPTDASRLRLGEEFREIQEKLKLAKLRDRFELELPQLSVRPADITQALLDTQPQIVHFSGHGTSTGALCFENQVGQTRRVQPDALAALFEQFTCQVNCVLLNACYSENQAKAIAEHIKYVIGMNQAIGDKAAIAFAIGFYQALGAGRTIEDAYKLGCVQIRLQGILEHLTPVLIKR
jgi:hypothetical protein